MKHLLTTLLMALLCTFASSAYAGSIILQDGGSYEIMNGWSASNPKTFTISSPRPADKLTFNYSGSWAATGGVTVVATYADGSTATITSGNNSGNQSYSFAGKVVTKLEFKPTGTVTKTIKNVTLTQAEYVNAPTLATLDFGAAKLNTATAVLNTSIAWSDVANLQATIDGADASQFQMNVTGLPTYVANYGTINIEVQYPHTIAGTHEATIHVSNGTYTQDIPLRGVTDKKDQSILWNEKYTGTQITLPTGKEITDAATVTSGLPITYTSSNDAVLAITQNGTAFQAIAEGTAVLTATQAGDTEWNSVSASKDVVVTAKKVQRIYWTDNLSRLKVGGAPITLTGIVQILSIEDGNETYTEDPARTALLTYQSDNEQVVRIDHATHQLLIEGEGTTTITATVPGDENYEGNVLSMPVLVRPASTLCDAYVLDDAAERQWSTISSTTYNIVGPAGQLTFTVKRTALLGFSDGNLKADIYYDGSWHKIFDQDIPKDNYQTYTLSLPRNTTQVKFYTETGATGYKHIKDVSVTMARYLETTTQAVTVEKSIIGDKVTGNIQVQYSNLPDELPIRTDSNELVFEQENLGNVCGEYDTATIPFSYSPKAVGTFTDVITIADDKTGLSISIPVTVHTQRNTQTITWDEDLSHLLTTDEVTLQASAKTAIQYSSSDENIAYVDADNRLVIVRDGTATITAYATEDEKYEAATLSKAITISLATPEIISLPTVAESLVYGTALTTDMLVGGSANIEGTFHWLTAGVTYEPGTYAVPVRFSPANTHWYTFVDTTVEVTVIPAEQTIAWNDVFDDIHATESLTLTATAQTEISYSVNDETIATIEGNTIHFLKRGEVVLTATAEGSNLYNAATAERTITVSPAQAEIITAPEAQEALVYGQPLSEAKLVGGETNCEGHFEWADPTFQQSVGDYWQEVLFVPDAADVYNGTSCRVYIQITAAPQEIVWTLDHTILSIGDTLALDATATSGYAVSYEMSSYDMAALQDNVLTAMAEGTFTLTAQQDGIDEYGYQNYLAATPISVEITIYRNAPTSINTSSNTTETSVRKVLRNGQIYILRGEEIYTLQGYKVQ